MRTKVSYGEKVIAFTEGDRINIETKDHKMLHNIVVENEVKLQEKEVTDNGEITPDDGYDGLSKVKVNVPTGITPSGELEITENGTHDVAEYESVNVNVPDSPLPIEVSTEAEMNALLESGAGGEVYKYVGSTTDTYESGGIYIIEVTG